MTHRKRWFLRCTTLALLAGLAVFGGQARLARAQDISKSVQYGGMETTSAVANSTNSSEVDTYASAVITDYTLWYEGYWAAVEADLYDNGTWIDYNVADNGFTSAKAQLSDPINLGHQYNAVATSALCWWEDEGDGYGYEDCSAVYELDLYGILGVPSISSISPNSGTIGKSGTITVQGSNLLDPFSSNASAAITGSGVTLSVNGNPSETSVGLNFSIASNASAGPQSLTLKNRFGSSNAETFTVGYPPAVVNSVSPSVWTAGQQTSVTITGTGFGSAPTLSATASGVNLTLNNASPDGTTIHATATVAVNAPNESVTISVQPGYAGSGFYCNCPPDQANGTDTVTVQANLPAPTINLSNGATNSPYAGQAISLSASAPSGSGLTISNKMTWSFGNTNDVVAGWSASTANGCYVSVTGTGTGACSGQSLNLTQTQLGNFYFIVPGQQESVYVDAYYNMADGSTSPAPRATQTFNIQGPTGDLLQATMLPNDQAVQITNDSDGAALSLTGSSYPGYSNGNMGIVFAANSGNPPNNGSFVWVQLVDADQSKYVDSDGSSDCPAQPLSGLDNTYPYASGVSNLNDSPHVPMSGNGEYQRSFKATMYLMWNPQLSSSIPVPLKSVSWSYSGCAIDTLSSTSGINGTSWKLLCGLAAPSSPESSGYPHWTNSATNNGQVTCSPHTY